MSNQNYINNFNLIRILAATQVLIVHTCNHFGYDSWFINALRCIPGVPVFFFTSGFLIGSTYMRNQHKGLRAFYVNRFLRLYPALWICILFSILGVCLTGYFNTIESNKGDFTLWILAQATFFQFYNPDFMRGYGVGVLNGSLWTIAVEIQFYLLTPIIYFFAKRLVWFNYVLFCVSICFNMWLNVNSDWSNMYIKLLTVSFLPWVYMFIFGYFFALHKEVIQVWLSKINVWILFIIYILIMNLIGDYHSNASNAINPLGATFLMILVFKFAYLDLHLPSRIKSIVDAYDLSYGVYIYHMPIINLLLYINLFNILGNIAISLTAAYMIAVVSWVGLERRVLKLKK